MKLKISIPPYPICGCLDLDKKIYQDTLGPKPLLIRIKIFFPLYILSFTRSIENFQKFMFSKKKTKI